MNNLQLNYTQETFSCLSNSFQCLTEKVCLSINVICDGNIDCQDKSDENDCDISMKFICGLNDTIIHPNLVCNYHTDCMKSNDDERFCGY